MKLFGHCKAVKHCHTSSVGDGDKNVGGENGRKVVVGVKLDQQSRELLTWALVKVVQPGDRVIALHIFNATTEEQSTLLSLVQTFDSMLAVYEGFCHLKQVDLKLKVCKGSSVRRCLVREAKQFNAATVIVGTSRRHHTIRSPHSVAKLCARKLPRSFSIFAVDNGKIVFQRESITSPLGGADNGSHNTGSLHRSESENPEWLRNAIRQTESEKESRESSKPFLGARRSTLIKRYFGCATASVWSDYSSSGDLFEESSDSRSEDGSFALVPYEPLETAASQEPNFEMNQEFHELRHGWPILRRVFLRKQRGPDKTLTRNAPAVSEMLKLSNEFSSVAIIPVEKHCYLDGNSGAIVPFGCNAVVLRSSFHGSKSLPKELEDFHEKYSATCRLFTYQELLSATSNFLPETMVGKGGSSQVFRGCLSDGKELAVKILKPSEDVFEEFIAEVEIITTINHKNIISLFGYCFEDNNLILVYDLLSRGSLEENLHGNKKDGTRFGLEERYKAAVGVAEALEHLRTRCDAVIHRDVKSSNILLSDDFEPQLADFGLATWASRDMSQIVCSDVAGTFGYLAPEYFMHGKVTEKIDIYAFGIVLLELLSGRRPIDSRNPKGQESLVMWATPILKDGKILHLLDPGLGIEYDLDLVERMVLAASLCIRRAPLLRPRIDVVLKLLQGDPDTLEWAKHQVDGDHSEDSDPMDGQASPKELQAHLNVAFLDIEDDVLSINSTEPNISMEDYLRGRWSRTPSFD